MGSPYFFLNFDPEPIENETKILAFINFQVIQNGNYGLAPI